MKLHQHKERMKKMKPKDLIPKEIMLEARNVVFSFPGVSYEEKLQLISERAYGSIQGVPAVNPRHLSMALDEALKTF